VQHADNAQLSPDGKLLAVCIEEGSDTNLWVYDLELRSRNRLVFQAGCGGRLGSIAWAPDGSAIVFGDSASRTIRMIPTDGGSGEASVLAEGLQPELSPDGSILVFARDGDLWYQPLDGSSDSRPVMQTPAREELPRISPSGDLLAYLSNETGRDEVFVRRFPSGDGRWQVSEGGADFPRWSKAGDRLYFLKDEVLLTEVDVTTRPAVRMSGAHEVFSSSLPRLGPNHGYDVMPDGRHFVMVHYGEPREGGGDLILVTNWK
jgi:Tol biopolymer transport system component